MSKTIDVLFAAVKDDSAELSAGALNDYFGIDNMSNSADLHLIYCIYNDLIKTKGVTKVLFENCFFTNRLDELIHTKSKYYKSGYYQQFCEKNIAIGKTYIGKSDTDPLPIIDDDHCPSCEASGYITNNQNIRFMEPDCYKCGTFICKKCITIEEDVGICKECHKIKYK
jgi:hypothetical protein